MTDIAPTHEPLKFAYWVPNVSGGLVISSIEQRTDWGLDYNVELARTAERVGFEYALSQVRYASSYGAAQQHESTSISLALLLATEKLKVISAIHPGIWHPAVLAKFINTADQFSHGRAAVNVVSGWFKDEYTDLGLEWLEHDERYERAAEFIQVLRGLWTQERFSFHGKYYDITDFTLRPFPYEVPGRAHPDIFQGGNSTAARFNGGAYADWYFSNGKDFDGFTEQYDDVTRIAAEHGRRTRFGLNGFVIQRDSRAAAEEQLREIIAHADDGAVEGFRKSVQEAGNATADKKGMWADSTFDDLVQYNDGFRTRLFGDAEQIAERIIEYKKRGVDLFLLGFLHFQEELERFGETVIPIVRELEADLARTGDPIGVARG
ncbi:MAG: dimethyl sulfone monooxygenase SfnG [Microbacterium sp. 71-36]|uniref:dimethylsulfone monooxygenase SfnG n=1 Tax=unclassified Microbacterium TaxID=2609290 RepID=UPI00086AB545|nr:MULTISPECIES: dimethyl sulfone monooxygenase SfnG [unclassified Microbacterium]MBN9211619.1 dimethyl sulfone monooxygenase SfnG [Microbacterium sp.]ODT38730.1 MAG: dimethyl sulfone monooxygenase SfnG [Microbacterium sp. SCN 71-17]ODU52963.1 MAG: dimethyl sulfone monooxygenase SfnG [Microbacterium sp. SCN 70-10]OJV75281.1 MAG: dimethyl sulfone monooxygenase SfnG [Microbacterium sp. 71-36]